MDSMDYDPIETLYKLFNSPENLDELPQVLSYTNAYKQQLNKQINDEIREYTPVELGKDIEDLIVAIRDTRNRTANMQATIDTVSMNIQKLDNCKKNLVLSMTVLKRLQMLINANEALNAVIPTHNYQEISQLFSVVRDLLDFFKPYKSIDEINQLSMYVSKTQNKLIDDVFIDFEDSIVNKKEDRNEHLIFGCHILETIDVKYKEKLLNWFYNLQLKEIKTIFNSFEEAGSLENLNRRFIYFNNVLNQTKTSYLKFFPPEWQVDLQLCEMFCNVTKEDLQSLVKKSVDSKILLDCLTKTLEFEKRLNEQFKTNDFSQYISIVFEPYLSIWVKEQDAQLQSKFLEFLSMPKIPEEFISTNNSDDFLMILRVNNLPNISNSSIELFKSFQKILTQLLKLSNGKALIDLGNLFIKYLYEYNNKILLPILPSNEEHLNGIVSIKYVTMLLNTGDYIINNITDLSNKFDNLIRKEFKGRLNFEIVKEIYYQLINKSVSSLLEKINFDLKFSWRQFTNANWSNMDTVKEHSTYMSDYINSLIDNIKLILPLIIRDSYIKTFCNRLVESIVISFMNSLKLIKPLSILNIEQILLDLETLKKAVISFPSYADPNYEEGKSSDVSNLYKKFVNNQFLRVETILNVLKAPALPVDNIIETYFQEIGDKSTKNFMKILSLKDIEQSDQVKYVENFKLQLTLGNDLIDESPILAHLEDEKEQVEGTEEVEARSSKNNSSEMKSPRIISSNLKINNLEKNFREFALNGENHVSKFNENFKNFGKFFRKDNSTE